MAGPSWLEGVRERLLWLTKNRGLSRKAISLRAGLSQSHVGQIINGHVGDGITVDVLLRIADGCGVSLAWLLSGKGSPFDLDAPLDPKMPNRDAAARAARLVGVPEPIIDSIGVAFADGGDPPAEWWLKQFLAARDRRDAGKRRTGRPAEPDE